MSATVTAPKFRIGDRVIPNVSTGSIPSACVGRIFIVRRVNPRNLRCDAEDGGRGINFPAEILLPATDENVAANSGLAAHRPQPVEFFTLGEIVTLKRAWKDWTVETPLVVLKDAGSGKVNVALLGGDRDRYARMPSTSLVKRDMNWLAETLVESVTA